MKKIILNFFVIIISVNSVFCQDIEQILSDADYFYENKYYRSAIQSYSKILNIDENNSTALIGRGKTYIELNIPDSAKSDFERALKINPRNDAAFYNLGRFYHYQNNFDNALNFYFKATEINEDSALYFLAIAQAYKDKNVPDSAFLFYDKTISVQPDYADAYYYKAFYNYELKNIDASYDDIEKGLEITSNDKYLLTLKAYLLSFQEYYSEALDISNLILSENILFIPALEIRAECYFILDSLEDAISDAEFVYMQDTSNFRSVIILSWSNYYLSNFEKSIFYAEKGKLMDYYYIDFFTVKGLSLFYSQKYDEAITEFNEALKLDPTKMDFYDYKIESILQNNTKQSVFDENNIFKDFNESNFELMDKSVTDKDNKYFYKTLLANFFEDNTSLSIDEYFMLYYGQSVQNDYAPYSKSDMKKMIRDEFSIGKYEETIKIGKELLETDPFLIDAYQYIAYSYLYLNQYDNYEKYMIPYHGFMAGIMATGNGNSVNDAYTIISVADEYSLLYFLGLFSTEQSLIKKKKNYYDVFQAKDYYGNTKEVYFNITKPYKTLSNIFLKKK